MSRLNAIKLELAKLLAEFGEIKTDKAIIAWNSNEDLREGYDVYVVAEDGSYEPAPDGEYVTEDNKTIVVKEGKVESITDPVAEVDPEIETAEVSDPIVETDGRNETDTDAIDAIHREINELYAIVDKLVKKVAELDGKADVTRETVEKMSKMSAALSAEVEINSNVATVVADKKFDNIRKMFNK